MSAQKLSKQELKGLFSAVVYGAVKFEGDRAVLPLKEEYEAEKKILDLIDRHVFPKEGITGGRFYQKPFYTYKDHGVDLIPVGTTNRFEFIETKNAGADVSFDSKKGLSISLEKIDENKLFDVAVEVLSQKTVWNDAKLQFGGEALSRLLGNSGKVDEIVNSAVAFRKIEPLSIEKALDYKAVDAFRRAVHESADRLTKAVENSGLEKVIGNRAAKAVIEHLCAP